MPYEYFKVPGVCRIYLGKIKISVSVSRITPTAASLLSGMFKVRFSLFSFMVQEYSELKKGVEIVSIRRVEIMGF